MGKFNWCNICDRLNCNKCLIYCQNCEECYCKKCIEIYYEHHCLPHHYRVICPNCVYKVNIPLLYESYKKKFREKSINTFVICCNCYTTEYKQLYILRNQYYYNDIKFNKYVNIFRGYICEKCLIKKEL